MKIIKVINNNVVSALDKDAEEVVIMGKGIGFHAKPGQIVNEEQIEKTFRLEDKKSAGQFARLVERLPVEYLKLSDQIITYAKNNIGLKLHQSIYLTLTDHISFAIERYKKGMQFDNPLKVEVKTFYPIEFGVGKYAIRKVREKLDVELNEDEAASVALHIVNAEYDTGVRNTMNITCLIRDVVNIVSEYLNIELQEESLHYARFITHLKAKCLSGMIMRQLQSVAALAFIAVLIALLLILTVMVHMRNRKLKRTLEEQMAERRILDKICADFTAVYYVELNTGSFEYMRKHIEQMKEAIHDGVELIGYTC